MPNFNIRQWIYLLSAIVLVDCAAFLGVIYYFTAVDTVSMDTHLLTPTATRPPTATPTPWAKPTKAAALHIQPVSLPTTTPTRIVAASDYAPQFYPTPQPKQQPSENRINFDYEAFMRHISFFSRMSGGVNVPDINQTMYPEPFFAPGTNNACGPVALFAGMQGLKANITYYHVRNIALGNDFDASGITISGLVRTAVILNNQLGQPFKIEQDRHYQLRDLSRILQRKGVVIVLVRVKKVNGNYVITNETSGSFGHFLVITQINMVTRRVSLGGSTLGMGDVPLSDFLRSWSSDPPEPKKSRYTPEWFKFTGMKPVTPEPRKGGGWALVLRRK